MGSTIVRVTIPHAIPPPSSSSSSSSWSTTSPVNHISVTVQIHGHPEPLSAFVDSGATHSLIDDALVDRLQLSTSALSRPIPVERFDGTLSDFSVTRVSSLSLSYSGSVLPDHTFLVTRLAHRHDLLLGFDFLDRFVKHVDFEKRSVFMKKPVYMSKFRPGQNPLAQPFPSPLEQRKLAQPARPPAQHSLAQPFVESDPPVMGAISLSRLLGIDAEFSVPGTTLDLVNNNSLASLRFDTPTSVSALNLAPAPSFRHVCASDFFGHGSTVRVSQASVILQTPPDKQSDLDEAKLVVPKQYHEFLDVFSKSKGESLPPHTDYDIEINLVPNAKPPFGGVYRLAEPELKALKAYINDMLEKGLIRQSKSPCASPVLFVPKGKNELRLCVDYRALNAITVPDRYPLPSTDMLLDQLSSAKIFTKIDLRSAYHRIRVAEGHEWKTSFRTRYGQFEYLVMPFGLTNAPAVFQRHVHSILHEFLDRFVVVYLDDILIYSRNEEEHTQHIRQVLQILRDNHLYAKASKCSFHQTSVEYLGFVVSPHGLSMDPEKISTVQNWPPPTSVKSLRGFLGFANFYRRFIKSYSTICRPLFDLTKKNAAWNWSPACDAAFNKLKSLFTSAPILVHFQHNRKLVLETDASDYGLGAVLLQEMDDKSLLPIGFLSRTMTPAERNYDIYDKELLAIVWAVVEFRPILMSAQQAFDIVTDHKNLTYFTTTKILNRRQTRWSEILSEYKFNLSYRSGKANDQADALSRREDVYPKRGESSFAAHNPANTRPIINPDTIRVSFSKTKDLGFEYKPDELLLEILDAQQTDQHISNIKSQLLQDDPRAIQADYTLKKGLVLQHGRILVPESDKIKLLILQSRHDHPLAGHPGRTKTLSLVQRDFTWPSMKTYITEYVKTCHQCQRAKARRHKPFGQLQPLPVPQRPWSSISMDFIEQLPESEGYDSILVVVCRLTKAALFIPTTTTLTATQFAKLFIANVFSKHGVPSDIVSDRGNKFTSLFWKALSNGLGIQQNLSTAYHPQTDGQTERVNQIIETYLRLYINYQQDNWSSFLPLAEFAYNNSPHSATGESPFFLNKGYHPTLDISLSDITAKQQGVMIQNIRDLHEHAKQEIKKAIESYKHFADKKRSPAPVYKVGDSVCLSTQNISTTRPTKKLAERRLGPFKIIQVVSPLAVKLDLPYARRHIHPVFHVSLLEPAYPDKIKGRTQPPPPPVVIEDDLEYEVEEILDSRWNNRRLEYLVQWTGYGADPEGQTWEPAELLENSSELVSEFHQSYPTKPKPSSTPALSRKRPRTS